MSENFNPEEVSLCPNCNCVTHTLKNNICGKCMKSKLQQGIFCQLCATQICKYELDLTSSGAVIIEEKEICICNDCAKAIATKLIEDN